MSRAVVCPLCGFAGTKAIIGPFPVNLCEDKDCSCVWGFGSEFFLWLADILQPTCPVDSDEPGWLFIAYDTSYLRALWRSIFDPPKVIR